MQKPTVHLNGTSRDVLVEANETAARALLAAIEALNDAAPNARDYYPQGDWAFNDARVEHQGRVVRLQSVLGELSELCEFLENT